jgi:hypothetical protein
MDIVFGNLSWLRFAKLDNNLKDLTIFISPTICPRSTVSQTSNLMAIILSLSFCRSRFVSRCLYIMLLPAPPILNQLEHCQIPSYQHPLYYLLDSRCVPPRVCSASHVRPSTMVRWISSNQRLSLWSIGLWMPLLLRKLNYKKKGTP